MTIPSLKGDLLMIRIINRDAQPLTAVEFERTKTSLHEQMIESLDLSAAQLSDTEQLRQEVRELADEVYRERRCRLTDDDRIRMMDGLIDEVFGLGPIEPLLHDPTISDILVNGPTEVFVERNGRLEQTGIVFADNAHVIRIIQRIVARVGRRVDESSPMVDARLPDGSRINAVIPPLAVDGPQLSIRRFAADRLQIPQLIDNGSLSDAMAQFLSAAVASRIGILVSGGTGAGKTTLLNALSAAVPHDERLITIEDSVELTLNHPHVVRLETRDANSEGRGALTQRDLVRNSLRMRPDRIIVGEVRGPEALDMLQAMNTGHEGSLTTIHANDTRDALKRLEMMVAMTGLELPIDVVRQYMAAGIRLIVHLGRLKGGVRRVMQVTEIVGAEDGRFHLKEIYGFRQEGLDHNGTATGHFFATGCRPQVLSRFEDFGVELPDALFQTADAD